MEKFDQQTDKTISSEIEDPVTIRQFDNMDNFRESRSLEPYYTVLYRQEVTKGILNHKYTCIIGDDKSARIPTLILGQTINNIYSYKREERVPVLFIDPHNYVNAVKDKDIDSEEILKTKVKDLLSKNSVSKGTILLVTDYISTGRTLEVFKKIAEENGLEIEYVSSQEWWGSKRSGLRSNSDKESIHAKPMFIDVKDISDTEEQFNIFEKRLGDKLDLIYPFYRLYKEDNLNELSGLIRAFKEGTIDEKSKREAFEKLTFENRVKLIKFVREDYLVRNRSNIRKNSDRLTKNFIEDIINLKTSQ